MISHAEKFLFVRIPKTAGTTLQTALSRGEFIDTSSAGLPMSFSRKADSAPTEERAREIALTNKSKYVSLFNFAPANNSLMHAPYLSWINAHAQAKDYFAFSFVRNPWDWVVSQYFFLKKIYERRLKRERGGRPSRKMYFIENREVFSKKLNLFGVSYEEFKLDQESFTFEKYVSHYFEADGLDKTQSSFLKDESGEIAVDFIGKFENLQGDWEELAKKINRPQIALEETNASRGKGAYRSYYESSEMKEIVENGLSEDIERFGYEF